MWLRSTLRIRERFSVLHRTIHKEFMHELYWNKPENFIHINLKYNFKNLWWSNSMVQLLKNSWKISKKNSIFSKSPENCRKHLYVLHEQMLCERFAKLLLPSNTVQKWLWKKEQITKIYWIQVNLVICGLFICEFAYSHWKHCHKMLNFNASFYLRIKYSRGPK